MLGGESQVAHRGDGGGGDRRADDAEVVKRAVLQRVVGVAGLLEVGAGEGVVVDDQEAAADQGVEVGLERGGVHRDERVGLVAGGEDLMLGEGNLEGADAGQGSGRGADFGGEVGEGAEVVAEEGGGVGEAVAGELHTVPRVTCEADGDALAFKWRGCGFGRRLRHERPTSCGR